MFLKVFGGMSGSDVFCTNIDLLSNADVRSKFPSVVHRTLIMCQSFSHLFVKFSVELFKVGNEFVGFDGS